MTKIYIIGAGQAGITAGTQLINRGGYKVYTISNREMYPSMYRVIDGEDTSLVDAEFLCKDYKSAAENADIILLTTPVHQYGYILDELSKHLTANKFSIGVIHGQGFFNLICKRYLPDCHNVFSMAYIPWLCKFIDEDKKKVKIHHKESWNFYHDRHNDLGIKVFLKDLAPNCNWEQSETFLEVSLAADNAFIHLPRIYELFFQGKLRYRKEDQPPLFYKEYGQIAVDTFNHMQSEFDLLRDELDLEFLLPYHIMESFTGNHNFTIEDYTHNTLSQTMRVPVINDIHIDGKPLKFDPNSRLIVDDVYYGLKPVIDLFYILGINPKATLMEEVYKMARDLHEGNFNPKRDKHIPILNLKTYKKEEILE